MANKNSKYLHEVFLPLHRELEEKLQKDLPSCKVCTASGRFNPLMFGFIIESDNIGGEEIYDLIRGIKYIEVSNFREIAKGMPHENGYMFYCSWIK